MLLWKCLNYNISKVLIVINCLKKTSRLGEYNFSHKGTIFTFSLPMFTGLKAMSPDFQLSLMPVCLLYPHPLHGLFNQGGAGPDTG